MKNFMCLQELLERYSKQLQYFDSDMHFMRIYASLKPQMVIISRLLAKYAK